MRSATRLRRVPLTSKRRARRPTGRRCWPLRTLRPRSTSLIRRGMSTTAWMRGPGVPAFNASCARRRRPAGKVADPRPAAFGARQRPDRSVREPESTPRLLSVFVSPPSRTDRQTAIDPASRSTFPHRSALASSVRMPVIRLCMRLGCMLIKRVLGRPDLIPQAPACHRLDQVQPQSAPPRGPPGASRRPAGREPRASPAGHRALSSTQRRAAPRLRAIIEAAYHSRSRPVLQARDGTGLRRADARPRTRAVLRCRT